MNVRILAIVGFLFTSIFCAAQNSPASGATATLPPGVRFPAQMITHLDARKAKVGDEVKLEVTANLRGPGGAVVLPQGAKLIGTVTAVSPRVSGEGESTLSFLVERAEWRGGSMALHAVPSAISAPKMMASRGYGAGSDAGNRPPEDTTRGGGRSGGGSTDSMSMIAAAIGSELKGDEVRETGDPKTTTAIVSSKREISLPTGTVVTLRQIEASVP
jgi:hypothetical protein